jgi:Uma2 family endonuclease
MLEAGIFEGQRFELIDGELIDKMGQLPPHAYSVARYTTWLSRVFTGNGQVRVQLPMDVGPADRERSQPEPDLVVVTNEAIDQLRHPDGEQTLLVVEVADSSVRFDITIKRDLYARAGVREYWVLDIPTRELIVYRHPQAGQYTEQHRLTESELASPLARPDASIAVSDLLPPR